MRKATILIVDDQAGNRFALEQMLSRDDRQLIFAAGGKQALTLALNEAIDLLILDIHMPDMEGDEVARLLKSNRRTRHIPILFVSAEAQAYRHILADFPEGNVDFLSKPLEVAITRAKVASMLNVTQQRVSLEHQERYLEKFALLINNSDDLLCIINPRTMQLEEVNESCRDLLGYAPEALVGQSLLDLLPEEDRLRFRGLQPRGEDRLTFEARIYTRDRKLRWLRWNLSSKNDLWFANARDITASREVSEIRSYLATVVKQSSDAVYLIDPEGQIISWNEGAEQMYGFSEAEALRMRLENLVPTHLLADTQDRIARVLDGEKIRALESVRLDKFGKIIDIEFSAAPIRDAKGQLRSVAVNERNITRQKQAEAEIKQLNAELERHVAHLQTANNELESFSYSVSHDLRAPLRSITGFAELIEADYFAGMHTDLRQMIEQMRDAARRMDRLINGMLDFARLGRKTVHKAPVDFNQLVSRVVQDLAHSRTPTTRIEVADLPTTEGDELLLYQVFSNLIANALKYSAKKEAPLIQIGSLTEADEYVYYVRDNGAGFNMSQVDRLFGVFQRLHHEDEFEGTGVGLATVQRILLKHGGRIWAEGREGEGATFYVGLPIRG